MNIIEYMYIWIYMHMCVSMQKLHKWFFLLLIILALEHKQDCAQNNQQYNADNHNINK